MDKQVLSSCEYPTHTSHSPHACCLTIKYSYDHSFVITALYLCVLRVKKDRHNVIILMEHLEEEIAAIMEAMTQETLAQVMQSAIYWKGVLSCNYKKPTMSCSSG